MSATESVKTILVGNNITFDAKDIQHGVQFRFPDGAILCVYDSGKKHWAGKVTDTREWIEKLIGSDDIHVAPTSVTESGHAANKKVFIVYGHDANAREQLELLLRRLRLEPVVLQNLPAAGETIIEKLEGNSEVRYACVLLTPDDEGHKSGADSEKELELAKTWC